MLKNKRTINREALGGLSARALPLPKWRNQPLETVAKSKCEI
jgi:hypothetical protein